MDILDVVVVGELNVDMILQDIPSFPEMGKEKLAGNMALTMGGASAILASNVARLEAKVGFIGQLGRDSFAEIVLSTLKNNNVDCTGIILNSNVQTGVTVSLTFPQNYAMVTYMGAMETFSLKGVDFDYLQRGKHLHFSSFYLQPAMRSGCLELFRRAKEMGMTTSLDPGWDPQEEWREDLLDVLRNVDIFLPNEDEALNISGSSTLEQALDRLSQYSKVVVIKRGAQGTICRTGDETIRTKTYQVEPVDTTGAGDSFNAGFLHEWLQGSDIRQCLQTGSACGALATTKMGGTSASPTKKELNKFLAAHPENIFLD